MESTAYIKNIKISPKKLRFLLADIKKRKPNEVLDYLFYSPTKNSQFFYKAIKSAISNAKNNLKLDETKLVFKTLTVEEGQKLRRFKAGGRGAVKPFYRKYSHIKVVLKSTEDKKAAAPKQVEVKKELPKVEEKKVTPKKKIEVNPAERGKKTK